MMRPKNPSLGPADTDVPGLTTPVARGIQTISAGKLRNLLTLCDENGRFKMLAVDQRGSLKQALEAALGEPPTFDDVAHFKRMLVRELAPYATGVLVDPIYGYAWSLPDLLGSVGVLMACEQAGYVPAGPSGQARLNTLIEDWNVAAARRAGANAIKLLLYYHPNSPPDVRRQQQDLCRQIGAECAEHDVPFLLELLTYPLDEPSADSVDYARIKPELVRAGAEEFSRPEYQVDLLKLELPGDLKFTREFRFGTFDGRERAEAYSLADVRRFCADLDNVCSVPWVLLSAGVGISEFLQQLELACEAGASGFLCGRAVWKDALPLARNEEDVLEFLRTRASVYFLQCAATAELARPLREHARFVNVELEHAGPDWYRLFAQRSTGHTGTSQAAA